jgi:T5orf172 domain
MAVPFNPSVSWFIPFHEHDPSTNDKCIYFTKRGTRCQWSCQSRHNARAIELYETITALPVEAVGIELLKAYILCICCMSSNARHRERIEDVELWTPLAERWLEEIRRRASEQLSQAVSVSPLEENASVPDVITTPAVPTSNRVITVHTTPISNSTSSQPSTPASSIVKTTPTSVASSSACQNTSPKTPIPKAEIAPLTSASEPRYDLRPRTTNTSTNPISVQPTTISRQFRAHIAEPDPTDSVSSKLRDALVGRDFETGSLYIFDRESSPGYVKIGWTAVSVESRLESWSKCDYTPNLLFSVDDVPHAQRAETLTHYELIKEWRRERQCQAKHCRKSHQEWFEVSKERATEVLGDWAKFMEVAEPYDSEGFLKEQWGDFVEEIVKRGEIVTAKKLLEHYELSLDADTTLVEELVEPGRGLKTEEQEDTLLNTPKLEELEDSGKASIRADSLRIEQLASTKETQLARSGPSSPGPIPLPGSSFPGPKKQTKSDQVIKVKPLPESEFSISAVTPASDNLLDSSAISSSKPKTKPTSELLASLAKEILEEQEKAIPPASITQSVHSAEKDEQSKSEGELVRCDVQKPENEIEAEGKYEGIKTEGKPETGEDGWDGEDTLVEVPEPGSLEKVVLEFVGGLGKEDSTAKTDGFPKASDKLKASESEALLAVKAVA